MSDEDHRPAASGRSTATRPVTDLPGKRRIRDAISSNLLDDYERFSVVETNWAGSHSIEARAETLDGRPFRIRIEITEVTPA